MIVGHKKKKSLNSGTQKKNEGSDAYTIDK